MVPLTNTHPPHTAEIIGVCVCVTQLDQTPALSFFTTLPTNEYNAMPYDGAPLSVYLTWFAQKTGWPKSHVEQHPNFWDDDNLQAFIAGYHAHVTDKSAQALEKFIAAAKPEPAQESSSSDEEEEEEETAKPRGRRGGRKRVPMQPREDQVKGSLF